jgi:uncharacterized protein
MQNKLTMQQFVVNMLKDKLPENYYYHNYKHTLYVQKKVIQIAKHENCSEKEIELLSAAALWHDTGYITTYYGHEDQSCLLAKKHLPIYGFSSNDTSVIIEMILATKILQTPKNKLEEILADADLEYLGTKNPAQKAHLLFRELQSITPSLTEKKWNKIQIAFIKKHHYFTKYCKENKDPFRYNYLNKLIAADK